MILLANVMNICFFWWNSNLRCTVYTNSKL